MEAKDKMEYGRDFINMRIHTKTKKEFDILNGEINLMRRKEGNKKMSQSELLELLIETYNTKNSVKLSQNLYR